MKVMTALKVAAMYFPKFVLNLLVELAGFFVVPIALLGLKDHDVFLPRWASAWDEPVYGINGDPYWPQHVGDPTTYWARMRWLFRNRAVGWSTKNGYKLQSSLRNLRWTLPNTAILVADQKEVPSDQPHGREGLIAWAVIDQDGSSVPAFYWIWKWPRINYCVRVYIGYKFAELWERGSTNYPSVPFVYSINPFKSWRQ
jgi:hypothetical protein